MRSEISWISSLKYLLVRVDESQLSLFSGKIRSPDKRGRNNGAFFYATNDDAYDLVSGYAMPATGVLLKPIEALARVTRKDDPAPYGAEAQILGKPNPEFIAKVIEWKQLERSKCCFAGDRLDTDILMGNRVQIGTIFVLTGVHEERDIERLVDPVRRSVRIIWMKVCIPGLKRPGLKRVHCNNSQTSALLFPGTSVEIVSLSPSLPRSTGLDLYF